MAGHHDDAGQAAQLLLQERGRGVVEMVGRLVQQQRGRAGGPAARPARAGRAARRTASRACGRAAGRRGRGRRARARHAGRRPRPRVSWARSSRSPYSSSRPAYRGRPARPREPVEAGPARRGPRGPRAARRRARRRSSRPASNGISWCRKPRSGGRMTLPASGSSPAGEQPQQGRLAGAVLADQADAVAGRGGQGDAVEHPSVAERADEVMGEQGGFGHDDHHRREKGSFRPPGRGPRSRARVVSVAHIADHYSGSCEHRLYRRGPAQQPLVGAAGADQLHAPGQSLPI